MYLGIDIGGTKIAAALVTESGEISNRKQVATPVSEGGPAILQCAIGLARELKAESQKELKGIGIGTGGQIDVTTGTVFSATDVLPGYKGLNIKRAFEEALHFPTSVDNDVNALAVGEIRFGAAREYADGCVVFLALGSGVGGALWINGKLHHGAHWSGAEFGHILLSIAPDARQDLGGARGTLESYCSGSGLARTYLELAGGKKSLSGVQVASLAANGDKTASEAIRKTGEYLGFGLVTLANALDPHLIVIGGGLSRLDQALLAPAIDVLSAKAMPGPSGCRVVVTALTHDAAVLGAAALASTAF